MAGRNITAAKCKLWVFMCTVAQGIIYIVKEKKFHFILGKNVLKNGNDIAQNFTLVSLSVSCLTKF